MRRLETTLAAVLSVVLLLAVALPAWSATVSAAMDHYYGGDFAEALDELTVVLADDSHDASTRVTASMYAAKVHHALGDEASARASLVGAKALDPDFVPDMARILDIKDLYFDVFGAELSTKPGIQTVAIIDFTVSTLDTRSDEKRAFAGDAEGRHALGVTLSQLIGSGLGRIPDLRVVERERLSYIQREHALGEIADAETAVRTGRLLGAKALLMGVVTQVNDVVMIQPRLVISETGEIRHLSSKRGKWEELLDVVDEVTELVAEEVGAETKAEGSDEESSRPPLDALRRYADGLVELDHGNLDAAAEQFQAALTLYPEYADAEMWLVELTPLLLASN